MPNDNKVSIPQISISPVCDDTPLLTLIGKTIGQMSPEELRSHVEQLRQLSVPTRLAATLAETETKPKATAVKTPTVSSNDILSSYGL